MERPVAAVTVIRGWWGSRRPPRSRVSAGVRRLRLRFSRVASQALVPTTTAPTVRRLPGPGALCMRRFYISARARRTRFRGNSCMLVSYMTLAYSALSSGFCGVRETRGLVHLLFVIKQLLCCARSPCIQSLLETAQYTAHKQRPIPGALRNNGLRPSKAPPALRQHAAGAPGPPGQPETRAAARH